MVIVIALLLFRAVASSFKACVCARKLDMPCLCCKIFFFPAKIDFLLSEIDKRTESPKPPTESELQDALLNDNGDSAQLLAEAAHTISKQNTFGRRKMEWIPLKGNLNVYSAFAATALYQKNQFYFVRAP